MLLPLHLNNLLAPNTGALVGATSLTFDATGTLTGTGDLSGSTSLTFTASGTLTNGTSGALTGSTSLSFSTSGTLTGTGDLIGSTSLSFDLSSSVLGGTFPITGSTSLTLSAFGTIQDQNNPIVTRQRGSFGGLAGVKLRTRRFERPDIEEEIEEIVEQVIDEIEQVEEQTEEIQVSGQDVARIARQRAVVRNNLIQQVRATEMLSERVAVLQVEKRINRLVADRREFFNEQQLAKAREAEDLQTILMILANMDEILYL
ncbi:MAG: hypothetical protein KTR33_13905 [Gammaproteobacteria bacterium]|nr:hypothetical protein [Gammaproteobacteria bacterium]